jgi:hypothetical protein
VDEAPVILGSAHRHGVRDEDLLHALRHHAETYDVGEGLTMVIGPDRTGVPMEVGVAERYGALCVVHAMCPARPRFWKA